MSEMVGMIAAAILSAEPTTPEMAWSAIILCGIRSHPFKKPEKTPRSVFPNVACHHQCLPNALLRNLPSQRIQHEPESIRKWKWTTQRYAILSPFQTAQRAT